VASLAAAFETKQPSRCARQQHLGRRSSGRWARRFWEVDLANIRPYLDQHYQPPDKRAGTRALMVEANRGLIIEVIDGHFADIAGRSCTTSSKRLWRAFAYGMSMELARTGVTAA